MSQEKSRPAPSEIGPGAQKDDNIDDMGNKPAGSKQKQPVKPKPK